MCYLIKAILFYIYYEFITHDVSVVGESDGEILVPASVVTAGVVGGGVVGSGFGFGFWVIDVQIE